MADVFISYSRKDSEFVQRLNTAFVSARRIAWLDWQNIPRGEDWWREIQQGIEEADAFICVISEHWLTSEICHNELRHAREHHKRVLPLIRQPIRDEVEKRVKGNWMDLPWEQTARDDWDYLRHLNWIFFDDDAKFAAEFAALLTALDEDQPHIKAHTRYRNDALEWERGGRNPSFLLSGDALAFAEKWLVESTGKTPEPTGLHRTFIAASRREADAGQARDQQRERRIRLFRRAAVILGILTLAAVLAVWVAASQANDARAQAVTAMVAQGQAINAQNTSVAGAAAAQSQVVSARQTLTPIPPTLTAVAQTIRQGEARIESLRLAALANDQLSEGNNAITASLLAVRALKTAYTTQADAALVQMLDGNFVRAILSGHTRELSNAAYSPDGRFVVIASESFFNLSDSTASIWDAATGGRLRSLAGHTDRVTNAAYSPDGRYIVTASGDSTTIIWDAATGQPMRMLAGHTDRVSSAAYSPDGRFIVTASDDGTARIWDADYRDFIAYACERMAKLRDFTDDERRLFGITDREPTCPQFANADHPLTVSIPTTTPLPVTLPVWTPIASPTARPRPTP